MTELKQEIFTLIEAIPDEKSDVLIKILNSVREILDVDSNRLERLTERVEERLALMEEVEHLVGEGGDAKIGKH